MSYRTFVDKDGSYWQVWDSQPTKVERRVTASDRRQTRQRPWGGTERRTGYDRRTVSQRRITLAEGYGRGWLTFESLSEKRHCLRAIASGIPGSPAPEPTSARSSPVAIGKCGSTASESSK